MNLNKAMIIGNLTRDPEVKTTTAGQTVAKFGVATNMVWTDKSGQKQEKVEFHNIVAWSRLADICGQYLRKGSKVYIEGRLQTNEWEGQDGIKRRTTEIVAENMIMLDRAGAQGGQGYAPTQQAPSYQPPASDPNSSAPSMPSEPQQNPAEDEIKVEDIPF